MQDDNYTYTLERIYSLYIRLCGGYYEPKSERDILLADDIKELLEKHRQAA